MKTFIEWLEDLNSRDTKVRAVLRRSLAFDPGTHVPAFPYVEPFLQGNDSTWKRKAYYLTAGLWGAHWKESRTGQAFSIGKACAIHKTKSQSSSTEFRFIAILDADQDQLPHRMRQMMALLKDFNIDYEDLLQGLLYWNDPQKRTQNQWARDFYRPQNNESNEDSNQ